MTSFGPNHSVSNSFYTATVWVMFAELQMNSNYMRFSGAYSLADN